MTALAVRIALVHRKAHIVILKFPIPADVQLSRSAVGLGLGFTVVARRKEWITAFGAEEVLFVVGAFTERRVVEGDETLVDDGCFAVIAPRCEVLMIVKMTIRPPIMLIRTNMLQ